MNYDIGTPVYNPTYGGQIGHICEIKPASGNSFVIGGMRSTRNNLSIVFEHDMRLSEVPDSVAAMWIERAAEMNLDPISDAAERLSIARQNRANDLGEQKRKREKLAAERAEFEADAIKRIPPWAKAVIVAELVEDESDSMTDYFGSTVKKSIILGFSKHTRDLFPEMRKAARNHPATADLADAPGSAEHREKYSMGGGYYLKAGFRHSNGWKVSKQRFYNSDPVKNIPTGEWALAPAPEPKAATAASAGTDGITIETHMHTKKGFEMHICIMPERVDRDEFNRLRDLARAMGGWYSRPWGKTPGGFAFKDRTAAEAFANPSDSDGPDDSGGGGSKPPAPEIGDKLRDLADGMQSEIDGKFADRLTNTPRRQRQADSARLDGYRLQRTQKALRALAACHDAGTVPPELAHVRSKKAAFELMRSEIDHSGGYYDAGTDTGKPALESPAALALWAMVDGPTETEKQAEELRRKVQSLQFANIPGFFPTPRAIIDKMIDLAGIDDGPRDILEPSAGSGAIVDTVREIKPNASVHAYECHATLREILLAKDVNLIGADFLESDAIRSYEFILMNPPFEKLQDIDHVRHAFDGFLAPNGRLVAIMSPGPFYRSDRKSQEFREWFDDLGGEKIDLEPGSFKESGTGVGAVIITLDKPEVRL